MDFLIQMSFFFDFITSMSFFHTDNYCRIPHTHFFFEGLLRELLEGLRERLLGGLLGRLLEGLLRVYVGYSRDYSEDP